MFFFFFLSFLFSFPINENEWFKQKGHQILQSKTREKKEAIKAKRK